MKKCPQCGREYDNTMSFCLDDGSELLYGPATVDEPKTAILHSDTPSEAATRAQLHTTDKTAVLPSGIADVPKPKGFDKRLLLVPLILVVIALGGLFGYRYFSSGTKQIDSVAVLPFENRSGSTDTDYLSDGLADSLIYRLSQLPNLKVSPTSSAMRYKGKTGDTAQVAKELNVDAVMSGRLRQIGDSLNISVQLVDARTEKLIWAEQYDRKMADLLATQREIAATIAQKLQVKLAGNEATGLTKKYTDNNKAYQLYLKGRYHWGKRTLDDLTKAVDNFKAAIEKDDNFALAYSGLADTYSVLQYYQGSRSNEFINKAMPYAVRAVELDDQLAEAHSSLAFVNEGSWKWADAEREYQRALDLNPNYSSALLRSARFLVRVPKRDADGLARIRRAVEIEPSSGVINDNLSQMYLSQGRADLALEQAKKTVELDLNFSYGWIDLAYAQLIKGQNAEALISAGKAVGVTGRSSRSLICLGVVNAVSGHRNGTLAILKELEERYEQRQADAVDVAAVHAGLGDKEQTFVWLDKAFADHSSLLVDLRAEYPFAGLLDDPRFRDLRKRMNMPE